MAGKTYLLDTNVIIDLFGGESSIAAKLSGKVVRYVPSVVLGELYFGAYNAKGRKSHHLKQIKGFMELCKILEVDEQTAVYYGEVKTALKKQGTPIPENDIWIAAMAIQHGLVLLSKDKHFDRIKVKRENY